MAENENQSSQMLRSLELRLLRCSLPSDLPSPPPSSDQSSPSDSHLHSLVNDVVTLIELGQYGQALSSSASQKLFSNLRFDSSESAEVFYSDSLTECIDSFIDAKEGSLEEKGCKALLVMAVGVAALLAFTQCNFTGPLDKLPLMPIVELDNIKNETKGFDWLEWEAWAHKELMSVGSDLRGKSSNLQYLTFAKTVLMRTKDLVFVDFSSIDGVRSISWWLARVLFLHQRLLADRSSSLFELLQVFMHGSLSYLGTLEKIKDYWGTHEDCSTILSMLHLEAGILDLYYANLDTSRKHFESAAEISNYNFFVSGALGFRTVHQVEPKAQLRLIAGTNGVASVPLSQNSRIIDDSESRLQQNSENGESTDVLMAPRFVADDGYAQSIEKDVQNRAAETTQLKAVHQALILAQCLGIEKSARSDEMQMWEMAPYIEAIDSQHSSPFIIQYFCDVLRIRWESTRSRTKQRALLMMDKLVQNIYSSSPGVAQRICYCFGVNMISIPALRKQYGDLLLSCGLTGEAVQLYEDLELWDNLVHCYQLMDKKAAAVELIKRQLSSKPSDPRLWCSLGDTTNDDTCYEKALEVSGNRSARAYRSLARSAYNRADYEKSRLLWESALALNSLFPDGWFALGAAALKAKDVDKALDAFTRSVQLDPENGEAWNNIACLHMIKKRNKESVVAFKEALKLKRDSWQMWENFSHVAADVGNFSQAMEAVQKVLDMTKKKRVDYEFLERITAEIEGQSASTSTTNGRETEHLVHLLGNVLRQIVQSGGSGESWGLYARWHKLKGDLTMCSEALLKQVRSYQGSDLWTDKDRFVKFANASLELCKVYQQLGGRKELFAAEMHLKSTIKQAVNFSESDELIVLVAFLEEVQKALKES